MAADSLTLGARIADARGRAGLTQAELASEVGLDRSALTKVENGSRRVSALELARIADTLGDRIEWFVANAPPSIVSHRNLREPGTASSDIDRIIERAARHVEFVASHDDRWSHPEPARLTRLTRPSSASHAERVARDARALLGLDSTAPVLNLADRVATVGLLALSFDIGPDAADAASILLPCGGVAVVNGDRHSGRRRLALAHELGHYLFADEYTVDWRIAARDDEGAWEARLDRFARAVLLPADGLRERWVGLRDSGDDVRTAAVRVASEFCVDMTTLAWRLRELRHVDQRTADQIRAIRTTRADIVEFNLVIRDELVGGRDLPRPYLESVLRLYRAEVVSADRALDLLFDTWDENDLPALPMLPENAIWQFVT